MKLQFKEQQFQVNAVKAVVDCFEGQTLKTNTFTLEKSKELLRKAKQASTNEMTLKLESDLEEAIGYRNSKIQITESQMLKNINAVQQGNELLESEQIERPKNVSLGYNLTIEMETGTGKPILIYALCMSLMQSMVGVNLLLLCPVLPYVKEFINLLK